MYMLLPNPMIKNIITGIIAPHGITDLVHAKQNNLLPELYTINIVSVLGAMGLEHNAETLLNVIFYTISIYHFRNDMPKIKDCNQTILSTLMILSFFAINPNIFLYYMVFIHVPNHYLMSWNMMSKDKKLSVLIISLTTLISMVLGNTKLIEYEIVDTIAKGLIFSHIIYEEAYIFKTIPIEMPEE